jgi:DNA-binding MarR family transcriptional regulator
MSNFKLLRTVLYLHHRLERASRAADVSISQYRMLYFLAQGPRRAAELATESSIRKPSITSLIATLEGKGWITREEDPDDRRALCIQITREGKSAMKRLEQHLQSELVEFLGEDEFENAEEAVAELFGVWNDRRKVFLEAWKNEKAAANE